MENKIEMKNKAENEQLNMEGKKCIIIRTNGEAHKIPIGTKVKIICDIPEYELIGGVWLVKVGWWIFGYCQYVKKTNVKIL